MPQIVQYCISFSLSLSLSIFPLSYLGIIPRKFWTVNWLWLSLLRPKDPHLILSTAQNALTATCCSSFSWNS